jgi:hypothetical protein
MTQPDDPRRHAPAAERNREPIAQHLVELLADARSVLEIAGGSGQHAAYFAQRLPHVCWQPSDGDPDNLASIDAWAREAGVTNILPAVPLNTTEQPWSVEPADAIFCANMIHISPFASCLGLFDGARQLLPAEGLVILYGPYRIGGEHTAPSNASFDATLRERDPSWGVRDLEVVCEEASARGFAFRERFEMPANNQLVVFAKEND